MSGTDGRPLHVTGAFAPVPEERTELRLETTGTIPPELCGTYVRNGPNPRTGWSPAWVVGEGMLHGVRLAGGEARWYRNRYCGPNTSVIRHDARILALVEVRGPVEVTPELDPVGPYDFGGDLAGPMTAHPKVCPRTGELHFFSSRPSAPHVTYHRAVGGRVVHRQPIAVPAATFMHDFAITARYAVFWDMPAVLGDVRSGSPFRWDDAYRPRIGVVPREGGEARWVDVRGGFLIHTANAWEDNGRVLLDVMRAERPMAPYALYRYELDLDAGAAREEVLDARVLEFPSVNPAFVGRPYRFAYALELGGYAGGGFSSTRLHQHDLDRRTSIVHEFDGLPGECAVVPRGTDERDAWVIVLVHEAAGKGPSELVVLDAEDFGGPPVARVRLPRVPLGFHGTWLPDVSTS